VMVPKVVSAVLLLVIGAAIASPDYDDREVWKRVPGGTRIHRDCIYRVPSGYIVKDTKKCPYGVAPALPEDQVYMMDVHYTPSSELMTQMNGSWTVPTAPPSDVGQTLYFWPGFKSDQPTMGLPVLQPVLQYIGGWATSSWFVYGNQGIAYESQLINASPGDKFTSFMSYDSNQKMWQINAINTNANQNSTLFISYENVLDTDFHVAMLVLETILNDDSDCAELPASNSITFTDAIVNGRAIQWTDRIQSDDCQQKIDDQSATVTFNWAS